MSKQNPAEAQVDPKQKAEAQTQAKTQAEPRQAAAAASAADGAPGDDLGRVRDILVGALQHEQAQALVRLENRIATQSAKLRCELDQLVRRLEHRITELDERATRDQDDLREQMKQQQSQLSEAIEERSGQVTALVTEGLRELREGKLDRQRFATFLSSLAHHVDPEAAEKARTGSETKRSGPLPTRPQEPLRQRRAPWYPVRPS